MCACAVLCVHERECVYTCMVVWMCVCVYGCVCVVLRAYKGMCVFACLRVLHARVFTCVYMVA